MDRSASPSPSSTIHQGTLNFPGSTFKAKRFIEHVLEIDRRKHHCFLDDRNHNHLSHHLLTAYDLGGSLSLLHKIYNAHLKAVSDINYERDKGKGGIVQEIVTVNNWTQFLGDKSYYANYLEFFAQEVAARGVGQALEQYVFANDNGASMLLRSFDETLHPLNQTGFGIEFGSEGMVVQALAQIAVHEVKYAELFDKWNTPFSPESLTYRSSDSMHRQPSKGHSLLSILRQAYDSKIMTPAMPYEPVVRPYARLDAACTNGRREEIRRLCALWHIDTTRGQAELDDKVEELLWTVTLLLTGSGKRGRKPRLDFFLMHLLNTMVFLPSFLAVIPSMESKTMLLRSMVTVLLLYLTARGRPRIDLELMMSYTDTPCPPNLALPQPNASAVGDLREAADCNPWPAIVSSVLHAPDPHTLGLIRVLYYAAQRYGRTSSGGAIGAFDTDGRETQAGSAQMDGTIFVRAAGVVMGTMGWVSHGQKSGKWDNSGLGWDDAWKK